MLVFHVSKQLYQISFDFNVIFGLTAQLKNDCCVGHFFKMNF